MYQGLFQELRVGPLPIYKAKAQRYEWYAFVRAHMPSIDVANKRLSNALKNKNSAEAARWTTIINTLDDQLIAILKYEAILDVDLQAEDAAYIIYRDKSVRAQSLTDQLEALGVKDTVKDIVADRTRNRAPIEHVQQQDGKLHIAPALEFDYKKAGLTDFMPSPSEGFDLARVLAPLVPATSGDSPAQLDSAGQVAYPTPAPGAQPPDISTTTKGEQPEEDADGNS